MDLNFQSFETVNSTNEQSTGFGGNIGDRNNLVGGGGASSGSSAPSGGAFDDSQSGTSTRKGNLLSFEYYQQFFDVETDQVIKRLLNSVVPTHRNYIQDFLQPIPDLWGPFWVSATLVFAIGIFGNLAQFWENQGSKGSYASDFRMVTTAATLIFLYVVIVPLLLYGLLWNRRSEMMHPYVDLMCLYGYSLAVFIPVTFLWIVDLAWFRWALIFVSVGLSGTVLARAIWPAVQNDNNKMIAFGTIVVVVVLHFLLAFTFKECFFDAMHPSKNGGGSEITTTLMPTTISIQNPAKMEENVKNETKKEPATENMVVGMNLTTTTSTVSTAANVLETTTTTAHLKTENIKNVTTSEKNEEKSTETTTVTVVKDEKLDLKPTTAGIAENATKNQ